MKKKFIYCIWTVVFLSACDSPEPESRNQSAAPSKEESSKRIVSLAPSITEILFALGLGDQVVGVTRYCDYPSEAMNKKKIGGLHDPDLDGLAALDPDVVILLPEHDDVKKRLSLLELKYFEVTNRYLEDVFTSIDTLGKFFGMRNKSDSILNDFNVRMNKVKQRSIERITERKSKGLSGRPAVLISIGRNMGSNSITDAYIAGPTTFYTDLLEKAGGENSYTGKMQYPKVSAEGLIRMKAEFIFDMVPDLKKQDRSREKIKAQWQSLEEMQAVKNRHIIIFDQDYSVIPGPRLIFLLEDMARALDEST